MLGLFDIPKQQPFSISKCNEMACPKDHVVINHPAFERIGWSGVALACGWVGPSNLRCKLVEHAHSESESAYTVERTVLATFSSPSSSTTFLGMSNPGDKQKFQSVSFLKTSTLVRNWYISPNTTMSIAHTCFEKAGFQSCSGEVVNTSKLLKSYYSINGYPVPVNSNNIKKMRIYMAELFSNDKEPEVTLWRGWKLGVKLESSILGYFKNIVNVHHDESLHYPKEHIPPNAYLK